MSKTTLIFRRLALYSYFLLLAWLIIWHFLLPVDVEHSALFIRITWIVLLLLPMHGLIKGKPYTHAWANFVVMIYLIHGLTAIYALPDESLYALIEIILATGMFIGCSAFARMRGRELGLGLKKLKDEMAEEKARFERP
jgi:uncharacterized membrane protein